LQKNADTDGDQRVTLEEFLAHQERLMADEAYFNETIGNVAHQFVATMDGDGDGKINLDEFLAGHAAFQIDAATSESIFRMMDQDGDNHVRYEELVGAVRKFYFSTDPNDPANMLMGPY
jgi:juvenile hormone diol kinase